MLTNCSKQILLHDLSILNKKTGGSDGTEAKLKRKVTGFEGTRDYLK